MCHTWQKNNAKLPETKAELYAELVRQIYECKPNSFSISDKQQQELHEALGRLAIKDIDESNSRFRLRESFIREELGSLNEKDSLFNLALRLHLLNKVGIAAESFKEEKVYAFLHPTFEEYFAALAINRERGYWNFFLPRKHKNKPVSESNIEYRIFKPEWQEVILFWLGREDRDKGSKEYLDKDFKETFINALIQFKDGCGKWNNEIINRGFYEYQTYFLAAKGIAEFDCSQSQTRIIVEEIIDYILSGCLICSEANATLMATNRKVAIAILQKRLQKANNDCDENPTCEIAEVLGQIDPGNWLALKALSNLLLKSSNEYTRRQAINVFWKIAINNVKTIEILIDIIRESPDKYLCKQTVGILGKIGKNNELAINALVEIFGNSFDKFNLDVYNLAKLVLNKAEKHDYLWSSTLTNFIKNHFDNNNIWKLYCTHILIDDFNEHKLEKQPKITDLIEIIENNNPKDSGYLQAIVDLGKVGKGDKRAIAALTKLCQDSSNEFVKLTAVESLYQIAPRNKLVIKTLLKLVKEASQLNIIIDSIDFLGRVNEIDDEIVNTLIKGVQSNGDERIICRAAENLGKIDPGNEIAIGKLQQIEGLLSTVTTVSKPVA